MITDDRPVAARDVFRVLYERHVPALHGFAVWATGRDRAWAEDIVQETLLRAWRHVTTLESDGDSARAWLFTVARRILIDHLRRRSCRPEEIDLDALDRTPAMDVFGRVLNGIAIEESLAALPSERRRIVVELYVHGHTAPEVARMLGIPEGTVRSRAHHAIRVLREELARRGVTEAG